MEHQKPKLTLALPVDSPGRPALRQTHVAAAAFLLKNRLGEKIGKKA